jgi:hypothetical protein
LPGRRVWGALSALLLAACEPPIDRIAPQANRLLVHAVMDLGATDQIILVERTKPDPVRGIQVTGATVTISTAATTVQALEDPPRELDEAETYRVPNSSSIPGFGPGQTITLRIVTPQGDTVSGTTTIPNNAPSSPPVFGVGRLNRDTDTLRLSWPRVAGARGYEVGIYSFTTIVLPGGVEVEQIRSTYRVFTDTAIVVPGTAESLETGDQAFPRNVRVRVIVCAVDDNYHTYFRPKVDPLAGAPPSRLTGAIGVFGSVSPVLIRFYDVQ